MRRVWLPGLMGVLGLALLAGGSSFGADQPTTTTKTETKSTTKKHTAKKPVAAEPAATTSTAHDGKQAAKAHLPAGFGKINLTAEQHQKAVAVMDRYAGQIKQLEAQIHDLRAKRDGELTALLNETQKKSLAEVKTNAQKVRQERRAAGAKAMAENPEARKIQESIEANKARLQESIEKSDEAREKALSERAKAHPKRKAKAAAPSQAEKSQSDKSQPEKSQPEKK